MYSSTMRLTSNRRSTDAHRGAIQPAHHLERVVRAVRCLHEGAVHAVLHQLGHLAAPRRLIDDWRPARHGLYGR